MRITLDFEMLDNNIYAMTISSIAGSEQADLTVEEIGDAVDDYIACRRKKLGIDE